MQYWLHVIRTDYICNAYWLHMHCVLITYAMQTDCTWNAYWLHTQCIYWFGAMALHKSIFSLFTIIPFQPLFLDEIMKKNEQKYSLHTGLMGICSRCNSFVMVNIIASMQLMMLDIPLLLLDTHTGEPPALAAVAICSMSTCLLYWAAAVVPQNCACHRRVYTLSTHAIFTYTLISVP